MKPDVCALLKLSKQNSCAVKSIKRGKIPCESEMHNKTASLAVATFCVKSKSLGLFGWWK